MTDWYAEMTFMGRVEAADGRERVLAIVRDVVRQGATLAPCQAEEATRLGEALALGAAAAIDRLDPYPDASRARVVLRLELKGDWLEATLRGPAGTKAPPLQRDAVLERSLEQGQAVWRGRLKRASASAH